MIGNALFRKKIINKFTWQWIDNRTLVVRSVVDFVIVERSRLGRLVEVHVQRGSGRVDAKVFF